jgi:hypothetical protein
MEKRDTALELSCASGEQEFAKATVPSFSFAGPAIGAAAARLAVSAPKGTKEQA